MTLDELCKQHGIDIDEQEKTASVDADTENSELANELRGNSEENSTNNDGGDMSLTDLYNEAFEDNSEIEKVAEAEELEKVASDYVAAGRFMARGFHDELQKLASAPKQGDDSEKEKAQLHAEGAGGVQIDDDSIMAVNTEEARNMHRNILKEKYINALLNKKRGVNVSGSTGQDNKVAPDARS